MKAFAKLSHLSSGSLSFIVAATLLQISISNSSTLASPVLSHDINVVNTEQGNGLTWSIRRNVGTEGHNDANTQKFFTRDISRIALLKKKMRDLDADQAVFPSDANYFDSARDFASKYHKVFYDEAWDANFWNQIITNSEAMLDSWNAFASKAIGNIFVVGTPISPNDPQLQSIVVYKVILPALQKNPHATALIIVDPTNFENWNTVWTPKTGVLDSTKSPADNKVTSDVKFEKVAALRPTDELNLENQDGLSENLTFDEA